MSFLLLSLEYCVRKSVHGDNGDNPSFPFSVNYSSALFLLLANISGLMFVSLFFWIIGLENICLNLVSGARCRVKMAKLGFGKDCNINDDNSNNNNYNSCVFVNGIIKVIFVYIVVDASQVQPAPPTPRPSTMVPHLPLCFALSAFIFFLTFLTGCPVFKPHPLARTRGGHKLR